MPPNEEKEYQRELERQRREKMRTEELGRNSAERTTAGAKLDEFGKSAQTKTEAGTAFETESSPATTAAQLKAKRAEEMAKTKDGFSSTAAHESDKLAKSRIKNLTAKILQWVWKSAIGSYGLSLIVLPFYFAIAYIGELIQKGFCRLGEEWFVGGAPGGGAAGATGAAGGAGAATGATADKASVGGAGGAPGGGAVGATGAVDKPPIVSSASGQSPPAGLETGPQVSGAAQAAQTIGLLQRAVEIGEIIFTLLIAFLLLVIFLVIGVLIFFLTKPCEAIQIVGRGTLVGWLGDFLKTISKVFGWPCE